VDFSKSPDRWFIPVEASTNGGGTEEAEMKYIVEHKRAAEKMEVTDCLQPGTSGNRFFWWRDFPPSENLPPQPVGPATDVVSRLRLFSSDITSLPLFPQKLLGWATGEEQTVGEHLRSYRAYGDACMEYPVREMEFPFEIEAGPFEPSDASGTPSLYSVITEEWSGTVVMTLASGDIIVLRYGHP
jgi:hypothetical protein